MRKDFIDEASRTLRIERKDLIEKDMILHEILTDLSKNKFFSSNFLFKGGTCLIKCYLGYFRFSEDIDFTWKMQGRFRGMTQKEIRRYLSSIIDKTGKTFEDIAAKRSLGFKCKKGDRNYVELGGSDKTVTFKIWYVSEISKHRTFIKVQINFAEKILFSTRRKRAASILEGKFAELKTLFPSEYREYSKRVQMESYDIREIICEKIRALLTRRGIKARDFIDVYLASKKVGIKPELLEKEIVEKINFALGLYAKYRNNLGEKKKLLEAEHIFTWGNEKGLLLSEIEDKNFYLFLGGFSRFLYKIIEKIEG